MDIFYEKNVGPTSSNIVRKRIQHVLSNMLDDSFSLAFSLLSAIVKRMNVLTLINVEKLLSRIAFVAGASKIILINFITFENRERFSVDRDFSETLMQKN